MTALDTKALLVGVTPGAWLVDEAGDVCAGNYAVALVAIGNKPVLEEDANARLIASAPRLARRVIELETRIAATVDVIESGYRGVDKGDKCAHDRYGFEDCIACYDEALLAALKGEGE